MALGALDAARALGVRVPDDLAVVGMDDTPMAAWPAYRLTTWGIAPDAIAEIMVRATLAPAGEAETASRIVRIPLSLALRNSTRQPG
jgi:DNA-binding LacI/PurR family transcriptional regulator